jgi:hypothetical protein
MYQKMKTVYIITNSVSKRSYVGITERKTHIRFYEHIKLLRRGKHYVSSMQEDFNRYGEASFQVEEYGSYEEKIANRMEYTVMDLMNSRDREHGYNYRDINKYKTPEMIRAQNSQKKKARAQAV